MSARPGIVWSSNGQAGDSSGRCECCGEERDEPHTWEECARQSAAHDIATVDRAIDAEIEAAEEVMFWKQQTLRALCRCTSKDCLAHGAYVPEESDRVYAARDADLARYRNDKAERESR